MASRSRPARAAHWIAEELGIKSLVAAGKDTHILILARAVRMFAYGAAAFVLALYFEALHISDFGIGLFMTLTLLGDVVISLLLTMVADKLGRRRILLLGSLMMAFSGVVFASTGKYWLLLLAAIIGVISPSGGEIGPFRAVEESTLAHLVDASKRSDVFAWYVVFGVFGTSAGVLMAGVIADHFRALEGWTDVDAYRIVFWIYATQGILKALLTLLLSAKCEADMKSKGEQSEQNESESEAEPLLGSESPVESKKSRNPFAHISSKSRWILLRLCALFCVDSLASGMVPFSLSESLIRP
jgi:MFS family permease